MSNSMKSNSFLDGLDLNELLLQNDLSLITKELESEIQYEETTDIIDLENNQFIFQNDSFSSLLKSSSFFRSDTNKSLFKKDSFKTPATVPSNVSFDGDLNFKIKIIPQDTSVSWAYSETLNKLYTKIGVNCPISYKTEKMPPKNTIIRFMVVFLKYENIQENIITCQKHQNDLMKDQFSQIPPTHFMRADNLSALYYRDKQTQRHSVTINYEKAQVGTEWSTCLIKFMCQNSCIGGNGKIGKPIQLLITLENNGNILARQKLEIKVCACPKRDLKKDEKLSPHQAARSPSSSNKELDIPIRNNEISDDDDNDKYRKYTIEITGKTNYLILNRIKQALEFQEKYSNLITQARQKSLNLRRNEAPNRAYDDDNRLAKFLESINMLGYLKTLQDNGIKTLPQLLKSTKDDLIQLNISNAHTNKLWNEIEKLTKDDKADRRQSKRLLSKRESSLSFTTTRKKSKL